MELEEIKEKMIAYVDLMGFTGFRAIEEIKNAKTKDELSDIMWNHESFLHDVFTDSVSGINHLKRKIGLTNYH